MSVTIPGRFDLVNVKAENVTRELLDNNEIIKKKEEDLTKYHILDISGNFITNIEINSISFYFKHITELYMINNELSTIPQEINSLINLEKLYLSKNNILNLDNIDKLNNLKVLDLRANKIKECSNLKFNLKLEYLSLSNNQLANLESLPKLDNLESLFLFSNQLDNLEETLEYLSNKTPYLKKLLLDANPSTPLNRTKQAIQQYRDNAKLKLPLLSVLDWKPIIITNKQQQ